MNKNSIEKAVALLSGGLDSTVSLAIALERYEVRDAIFFEYGQAPSKRERSASGAIAAFYGLKLRVIPLPWLAELSSSALVRKVGAVAESVPAAAPRFKEDSKAKGGPPAVWVENRNGIFLNIGAAFALSRGASVVIAGFNREEAVDFPDNSAEFIEAVNRALETGEVSDIRVESPTIDMDKKEIVNEGLRLGIPWDHLWSCYRDGTRMCGECESCLRLRAALEADGAGDKVRFEGA